MTFTSAAFQETLEEMTELALKLRKAMGITSRNKLLSMVSLSQQAASADQDHEHCDGSHVYCEGIGYTREPTAHEELQIIGHERKMIDLAQGLVSAMIETAPILDQPRMDMTLRLGQRKWRKPQISMSLLDIQIMPHGPYYSAEEMGDRLAWSLRKISHLEPGDRLFLIDDNARIRARSPEDAFWMHAALAKPGLFDPEMAGKGRSGTISEIFDVKKMEASLLAPAQDPAQECPA